MEFAEAVPIIIILFIFLLIGIAVLAGVVVMIKKSSSKNEEKQEINLDLKRRVETLEKEVKRIKDKKNLIKGKSVDE